MGLEEDDSFDQEKKFFELWERLYQDGEKKFSRGRRKYGDSWKTCDPNHLYRRFEEEQMEFRQAVEHFQDEEEAVKEMADIVNFGLMFLIRSLEEEGIYE